MNKSTKVTDQKQIRITPRRFQDHMEGKEGQILLAAFQCIAEKGIAAASTHAIAAKAGLNQGIIHYYFKSKDQLLQRVLEIFFHNAITNIEAVINSDLTAMEKLESFFDFGHSLIVPRREEWIVYNTFWAHAMSVGGEMKTLIQMHSRRFQTVLMKIFREIEQAGYLKPGDAKDLALLLTGAIQGMANIYIMDPEQYDAQRLVALLKSIVLSRLDNSKNSSIT